MTHVILINVREQFHFFLLCLVYDERPADLIPSQSRARSHEETAGEICDLFLSFRKARIADYIVGRSYGDSCGFRYQFMT